MNIMLFINILLEMQHVSDKLDAKHGVTSQTTLMLKFRKENSVSL